MNRFFDLRQQGWCTPTILVGVLGLLAVIALSVQLATNKDKTKTNGLVTSLLVKLLWTMGVGALLFWMCSRGRVNAAWWTFGLLYLVPMALLFIALAAWFYTTGEEAAKREQFNGGIHMGGSTKYCNTKEDCGYKDAICVKCSDCKGYKGWCGFPSQY